MFFIKMFGLSLLIKTLIFFTWHFILRTYIHENNTINEHTSYTNVYSRQCQYSRLSGPVQSSGSERDTSRSISRKLNFGAPKPSDVTSTSPCPTSFLFCNIAYKPTWRVEIAIVTYLSAFEKNKWAPKAGQDTARSFL